MCARLTGPMHSDDARNKFAGSMVFIGWKGLKTVRQLVTPVNRKTGGQGDVRLVLGGCGRGCKPVAIDSLVVIALKTITVGANSWISNYVKFAIKNYFATPLATSWVALVAEYNGHGAKAQFVADAADLGLTDFDISYKSVEANFSAGMQLYVLAKYLCDVQAANPDLLPADPFDTALSAWVSGDVDDMVTAIQTPV